MDKVDGIRSIIRQLDSKYETIAQIYAIKIESGGDIGNELTNLEELHKKLKNVEDSMDQITNDIKNVLTISPSNNMSSSNIEENEDIVEASPFPTLYCENLSGGPLHMVINSNRNIQIDNEFFKGEVSH